MSTIEFSLGRRTTDREPASLDEAMMIIRELRDENTGLRKLLFRDLKTNVLTSLIWQVKYSDELQAELDEYHKSSQEEKTRLINHLFCLIDMNGLKKINTEQGYEEGDKAIQKVASAIVGALRERDLVFRQHSAGDEFIAILGFNPNRITPNILSEKVESKIKNNVMKHSNGQLSVAIGSVCLEHFTDIEKAQESSEKAMIADKNRFYQST